MATSLTSVAVRHEAVSGSTSEAELVSGPIVDIQCGLTLLGRANCADHQSPTSQVLSSSGVAETMRDVFTESDADDLANRFRDRSEAEAASARLGVHAVPEAS